MRWLAIGVVAMLLAAIAAAAVPKTRRIVLERLPPAWRIQLSAWRHGVVVDHESAIAVAGGVTLRASLYLPRSAQGPLPTILIRVPYGRTRYFAGITAAVFFAKHGYAALVEDLRGTGDSGGELIPYEHGVDDGAATLDWIARQPWSDGKVGTFGCSALGETQLVLSKLNHPAHLAMIPIGSGGGIGSAANRYGYFGVFDGGVPALASAFGWFVDSGPKDPRAPPAPYFDRMEALRGLPSAGLAQKMRPVPSGYEAFMTTPLADPRWASWGYLSERDQPRMPAFFIDTWGDGGAGDVLALAEAWRRADPRRAETLKVVMAPGAHCHHDEVAARGHFGELPVANADRPYEAWYLAWFDHWLRGRGEGLAELRTFNYFMLVENRWLASDQWPPAEARVERWHLGSGGNANTRAGDGLLAPGAASTAPYDEIRYNPLDPVPSRGGPICCTGEARLVAGPVDQADVEWRQDVLVYTSAPLARALRIAGPLKARIAFSSSAPDTDLVARLVHVWPNGRVTNIQEGALRLRYRDSFAAPAMMVPGQKYEVTVDMRSIAYRVPAGHRLRLDIASSSFPRLERNLNTGAAINALETNSVIATNRVHHAAPLASWVELPLLPDEPAR